MTEGQQAALREMVKEIGSEPQQDTHFDAFYYPEQTPQVLGIQSYAQSVIRQYVKIKGGDTPSPAFLEPMNAFMAAVQAN